MAEPNVTAHVETCTRATVPVEGNMPTMDDATGATLRATGNPYAYMLFLEMLVKTYEAPEAQISTTQLDTCDAASGFLNDHLSPTTLFEIMH